MRKIPCAVDFQMRYGPILRRGKQHIPTAMVSGLAKDITISLYSPTKTFNLASLRCAYAVAYAPWLRDAMEKAAVMTHFNNPNVLSCEALIGAYQEGGEWGGTAQPVYQKKPGICT